MDEFANVDDYIAAQSAEAQPHLRELREIIRAAIPDASEVISYGMPTYKYRRAIIYYGAAKAHCGLYGAPLAGFAEELKDWETSKGTVKLPHDKPLPVELIRTLTLASAERNRASELTKKKS